MIEPGQYVVVGTLAGHELARCFWSEALNDRDSVKPDCPGPDCPMCAGESCNWCGAGCWNCNAENCEHDAAERHAPPGGWTD